ncbi:MAG: aminoacyl-histidine dipeptidase [Mogibacterium sp.]|nr:aminoacyl-histidine dipeptidase [Mogibacterium sp.]
MGVLSNIEPKEVFEFFEQISNVPRRTFRNDAIGDFCVQFAIDRGLEYVRDEVGNVVIYKKGTPGYEDSEPVILQGHMDMVANKVPGTDHDFDKDPLELFVDGNFVGARNTTLGADDGIALAYIMAILDSDDIPHPPIEAVFTVDEEIGMGGADAFDASMISGKKYFNIDGEEDGILTVGCAGGAVVDVKIPVNRRERNGVKVTIKAENYLGGHSGNDIQKYRGNAHKDMGRLLYALSKKIDFSMLAVDGGGAANVIAQDCTAEVVMSADRAESFIARMNEFVDTLRNEYGDSEPDFTITAEVGEEDTYSVFNWECTINMIWFLYGAIDGVQTMDRKIEGAVESSLNTGIISTRENSVLGRYQERSSIESKRDEMVQRLGLWAEIVGGHIKVDSSYPAWPYNPDSELRPLMIDVYKKMYGKEPIVNMVHGGLEGGIMMGKNPELDIVSFGPNIFNVHTPSERLDIQSTQKYWEYLKAVLAECK